MADFKTLTPDTIDIFAKRHYDNPSDVNGEEFEAVSYTHLRAHETS